MTAGDPFNPWREACGFYPPDIVGRQRTLGDGPKRLYERMVRWAGKNGRCWHGQETMAEELGKTGRQVRSNIRALEAAGLISHRSRDGRRSNTYVFLWNDWFERKSASGQSPGEGDLS